MKKVVGVIITLLLIVLVGIQFIPTNQNPYLPTDSNDFIILNNPPVKIGKMLKTSCYNCHSDQINYPWYSKLQPAAWLLEKHIREGKEELNLSQYGSLSGRMEKMKLESMIKQIEQKKMPISSYTLIHQDAILSDSDRKELVAYLQNLQ
ncbi:heme-binding domain-containing protein [Algoriphagus sp. AGSA1]|uniref:Heme-binding protein n=1 Tax=Algoriphagus yeomjeoni TaxID=291403 RepID=A0A327P722_9BACT|nr:MULTISPECIES: heme-binding domain-containing protein [Algoriphagus]MCE7053659.1 heme-binding domain-containing protein [Algoriphagus sp. AGSA1]RAI88040.1 heme-binding protein [Algoriphagus yeomjeoni]